MKIRFEDIVEERLRDLCTPEEFCFGIKCEQCGDLLSTPPARFVKAGITPENDGQKVIFETMYQRDKQRERDKAITTLASNLNYCPICKHIVCNHCFVMTNDIDICKGCAKSLGVTGTKVNEIPEQLQTPPGRINRTSERSQSARLISSCAE